MSLQGKVIGVVGPLPPPAGGMANQTMQLVELLRDAGAEVKLLRVNAPYWPNFISNIKGLRAIFRLICYVVDLWKTAPSVQVFHVMANSGWSWHLFAAPAIWVARLRGKPVVLNYRGGHAQEFFARSWAWVAPSLRRCTNVIVPSEFLLKIFDERGIKAEVVPNILDLERFAPAKPKAESERCHIIVTRNLEAIYDVATAIEAFAIIKREVPRARLTIAGSGPLAAELQRLAARLGVTDDVRFTGRLSSQEIAALYKESDLMLNASVVDNSPNSIIEALASGVPVVTTNVGGIPYLIEDRRSGLLVEPKNPAMMAKAALSLIKDQALKESLVAQGLDKIKKFDKRAVLKQLEDHYHAAMHCQIAETNSR